MAEVDVSALAAMLDRRPEPDPKPVRARGCHVISRAVATAVRDRSACAAGAAPGLHLGHPATFRWVGPREQVLR